MISKMLEAIKRYNMLSVGDDILVAVSGGADSVALFLALSEIADQYALTLKGVHINHHLRGEESNRDEKFVRALFEKHHVPLVVSHIDAKAGAKNAKMSVELYTRQERYRIFKENAVGRIATAHTLSDHAETVLLNLVRGTGISGLCGIPPVRDNIIRPLIFCSREDILKYLSEKGQQFLTDSTNLSDDYRRNRIRHHVLPPLLEVSPAVLETTLRMSENLSEDRDFLESLAREKYKLYKTDRGVLKGLKEEPAAVRKRVLKQRYSDFLKDRPNLSSDCLDNLHLCAMDAVLMGQTVRTSLPNDCTFERTAEEFIFDDETRGCDSAPNFSKESADYYFDRYFRKISKKETNIFLSVHSLLFNFLIDCDKIVGDITFRGRLNGDKYRPVGRGVTKSLRKLLGDAKLSTRKKNRLFVITDDCGIIFTNLFGADERVRVTERSHNIAVYKWEENS